ncbi:MAG: chorismate synthase, partial [Verrucomicrobia bacterium]|nr:chorismate synthase [Verrucomicrobiota bacterium]
MSSSFGTLFRITTFGESHCKQVGVVVDGCPPRLPLVEADIQPQLDRRRPGQSNLTTPRKESDTVTILSGTENGITLGTPIGISVPNLDQRPHDYGDMQDIPRPSHADFVYQQKYGVRASSGGGRSSARETIGRVAAGAIAEKILKHLYGVEIVAWVSAVGTVQEHAVNVMDITRAQVDATIVRCADPTV